ncbi:hypothetical protein F2P47_10835 [Parvibaculum sedimenti]|uniref:Uncharacterized protein n=1 Tax=Parvibaculum sedimenti TaxID=2608632 RepID=A0A6N6VHV8_9HYPH|nr:hypothetical protein [Parvibaculum sedimenti]KAB7739986.1 hypothetical protein F2P47_10835 [Parvibaculum sedimenti]
MRDEATANFTNDFDAPFGLVEANRLIWATIRLAGGETALNDVKRFIELSGAAKTDEGKNAMWAMLDLLSKNVQEFVKIFREVESAVAVLRARRPSSGGWASVRKGSTRPQVR